MSFHHLDDAQAHWTAVSQQTQRNGPWLAELRRRRRADLWSWSRNLLARPRLHADRVDATALVDPRLGCVEE